MRSLFSVAAMLLLFAPLVACTSSENVRFSQNISAPSPKTDAAPSEMALRTSAIGAPPPK